MRVDYSDGAADARSLIREFHLTYPMLRDPDGKVGDRYGVRGLPTTVILDLKAGSCSCYKARRRRRASARRSLNVTSASAIAASLTLSRGPGQCAVIDQMG